MRASGRHRWGRQGLKPRLVGGAASGSLAVVEEFSTLHFRSSLSPGSMLDEDLDY
jgi:hypothetical protein